MSATMTATSSKRTNWKQEAEMWRSKALRAEALQTRNDALIARVAALEAENEALGDRLDVWEQSAVAALKEKADAYDELTALLADYRRFGWTDRLDEALRLATGERF